MSWQERIIAVHTQVTDAVRHAEQMQADRYLVWQEDGKNDLLADGQHIEQAITGTTDLFTKQEFDPWIEALEQSFDAEPTIFWEKNSTQYEEETGLYHYEWRWEVLR